MKTVHLAICMLLAVLLPRFCQAELVGPYTADADTLYLFHLDEAAGGSMTTNDGSKGKRAYTVNMTSASQSPPVVTDVLGAASYAGFGNAASFTTTGRLLGYDQNNSGAFQGDLSLSVQSADRLALTNLNIGLGGQSPFTLEALVSPADIFATSQEIICTDNSQANANRGFMFRITSGNLQFNRIGDSAIVGVLAPIPTTGPHAFVANEWFHVAAVYDGTDMRLYWTALTNTSTSANLITNAPIVLGTTFGSKQGPLIIGNDNRAAATELFNGLIDEVRISKVARAANEFVFRNPITIVSEPQNTSKQAGATATFTVVATTDFGPLSYQWQSNGVPMVNGGDISGVTSDVLTLANVSAAYAGINYSCSITNSRAPVPDGTNSANATLTIVDPASLVWNNSSFNYVWDTSSQNWSNSLTTSSPVAFSDFDNVRFDNTDPLAGGTIALSGTLSPNSITVASDNNYTFSGGEIAGATGLTKSGNGTLTLSSAGSYAGVTAISNGTVVVGSATALGSAAAGTVIASGATLDLNGTVDAAAGEAITVSGSGVGGNGAIVNNGGSLFNQSFSGAPITLAGDTTLGGFGQFDFNGGSFAGNGHKLTKIGANSVGFTGNGDTDLGDIAIQSGGLTFAGSVTLGRASSNLVIHPSATLNFDAVNNAIALEKNIITTNGTISTSSGTTLLNTPIVFNTALELGGSANTIFGTNITGGTGSLTKTGAGTVSLNAANNYSGATIISEGSLSLGNVNALQNTSGINIGGAGPATLTCSGDTTDINIGAPITAADSGINSTIAFGRNTANAGTLTLSAGITGGAGNVVFTTPAANGANGGQSQTIVLGSASSYGGTTTITTTSAANQFANTIKAGEANALPATTVLTFFGNAGAGSGRSSTYDLNGFNQELAGLDNGGLVVARRNQIVTSLAPATLTLNNTADYIFGGAARSTGPTALVSARIQGAIALTKSGPGTFTLGGNLSGSGVTAQGNTFTGATKVLGGILVLGETLSIQNSPLDTLNSIAGDANNGLRSSVSALTFGGLTGNKALASVFDTSFGSYGSVTALTLNPGLGASYSYSGAIADGFTGMTLTKSGAGTQTLTGGNNWTGETIVSAGKLAVTSLPTGLGALTVTNSATLAITAAGASQWTPASLTVDTCTLEFNNVNTTTAPLAPAATVATPVTSVTINVISLAGSPTVGSQYALVANVTDVTGYSIGLQPPGYAGDLVVSANTLYYQVSAINDFWTGTDAANPTFWNIGISTNWAGNAAGNTPANTYAQDDTVLFDDTATTFTVAIQTPVTPGGVNFNNSANAYTVTGSGANVIGGTGGLTKLGTAKVTLSGGEHAYSGVTTISAGTLQLDDAALTHTSGVLNNSELVYNMGGNGSASYPITGNGTVAKDGAGTLTLLGTNSYIGVTTINAGTLEIGGSGTLGSGSYAAAINNNGALLYSSSAEQTLNGTMSGTGAVTKAGAGTLALNGGSTFSGQMTVENGTVSTMSVPNDNAGGPFGQSPLPVILGSFGNTGTVRFTTTIGNLYSTKRFTMASGGSGGFEVTNASTTIHIEGLIDGAGGLIKTGPGALNVTDAISYTGNTTVSNGTLRINVASIATNSTVTVAGPGVLNLGFAATNLIAALVLDGVPQAPGLYNAGTSSPYLAGAGSLQVAVPGPSGPAMLTHSVSGNTLTLSWPAGEGWRLESQTNALTVGLSTNWVEAADSSVSSTNITIDPALPTTFYRLAFP